MARIAKEVKGSLKQMQTKSELRNIFLDYFTRGHRSRFSGTTLVRLSYCNRDNRHLRRTEQSLVFDSE